MQLPYLVLTGNNWVYEPAILKLASDRVPRLLLHREPDLLAAKDWLVKRKPEAVMVVMPQHDQQAIQELREVISPDFQYKVLVLGKYDDLKIGSEYIQLGVEAYIPVSRMGEEFMDSIEQLLTKGYVGSYLANQIIKHYTMQASVKDLEVVNHALTVLTRKQLQVLRLRVLHPQMSNQQIADILQVSLNTVEKHITQIISRLEVQGNKGLTQWLADYGVLLFGQWSARYRNLGDS